jgi:hypothetical protein
MTSRIQLLSINPVAAADLSGGAGGGFDWAPGGPYQGTRDACSMVVKASEAGVFDPTWGVFAIVRREDGVALGGIGFHGPPTAGVVEIGYDLADSARGLGYATEAVAELTATALDHPDVACVLARTELENVASQAVLVRAGFVADGVGEDQLHRFLLRG